VHPAVEQALIYVEPQIPAETRYLRSGRHREGSARGVQAARGSVESLGGDGAKPRRSIASPTPAWASARPGLEPDPERSARGCFRKSRLLLGTTSRVPFFIYRSRLDEGPHLRETDARQRGFIHS
jgi:hypothetical protein